MTQIVDTEGVLEYGDVDHLCFGYLEDTDTLYLGSSHHAAIIANLVEKGMTFEQLMASRQMWGWTSGGYSEWDEEGPIEISFASDEAIQSKGIKSKVVAALKQVFPGRKLAVETGHGYGTSMNYGDRAKQQYLNMPIHNVGDKVIVGWGGVVGTVVGTEEVYGEVEYKVKLPDGDVQNYLGYDLRKASSLKEASAYTEPAKVLDNGVKVYDTRYTKAGPGSGYWSCCFGFLNDKLYIGDQHHAKIIFNLVDSGQESYESLMGAAQKWGWVRQGYSQSGALTVSFTTDEALQTHDKELSDKVIHSIGDYFNTPAEIDSSVGEGYSSTENYGERSKQQYFGEEAENEAYCEECDTYYDPDWESHDHSIVHCDTCEEYYDENDDYQYDQHNHNDVTRDLSNKQTQQWFVRALELGREQLEAGEDLDDDDYGVAYEIREHLVSYENFYKEAAEWLAEQVVNQLKKEKATPVKPAWVPQGLQMAPIKHVQMQPYKLQRPAPKVGEKFKNLQGIEYTVVYVDENSVYTKSDAQGKWDPAPSTVPIKIWNKWLDNGNISKIGSVEPNQSLIRVTDLHDAEVFAKLSYDYINSDKPDNEGGAINKTIEVGSQWKDPQGLIHTVMKIGDGAHGDNRVYYNYANGHGSMSADTWHYYMKPLSEMGQTTEPETTEKTILDPEVEKTLAGTDDPALLTIERNPESKEWRWSMDDDHLHIWRVLNRWQYGPSHYDMFGSEGYSDHSQGRVYVAPDGRVGVLYWQISHPNAEQTLNDWVQRTFGKQPDMVYRAYGPYKGYKTPRWYFPIVEVSGLPIGKYNRWWENGEKPNAWYSDNGIAVPSKKRVKDYPAKKNKKEKKYDIIDGDMPYNESPNKAKRRKKRQRNRQYRNRGSRR